MWSGHLDLQLPAFGSYGIKRGGKKKPRMLGERMGCVFLDPPVVSLPGSLWVAEVIMTGENTQKYFEAEESEGRVCSGGWH